MKQTRLPLILILFVLAAINVSAGGNGTWSIVNLCPSSPFCINSSYPLYNTTVLREGESINLTSVIQYTKGGSYYFKAIANSTANSTEVSSNQINITIFSKSHVIPLCINKVSWEPFCVNNSYYNTTVLYQGESTLFSYNLEVLGNNVIPSNWTFFIFANSSANGTEVNSNKINIEISSVPAVVPLSVTINQPTNVSYTNKTVLFDIDSAGDNLRNCWYNIGSGIVPYTCNSTFQLDLSEGQYSLFAYANQTNGSETSANVSFSVNTNPLLTLNKPDNNAYFNVKTIDFNWTVIDSSNTSFSCDLYFGNNINKTTGCYNNTICNMQVTEIPDLTYDWKVNCSDGVYSNMSSTRNFTIDTINPGLTITNPLNISYRTTVFTINATTNEWSTCVYSNGSSNVSMDRSLVVSYEYGADYTAILNDNHITVSCNDTANNWNSSTVYFIVDLNYPNWTNNYTIPGNYLRYNPAQNYIFSVDFIDTYPSSPMAYVNMTFNNSFSNITYTNISLTFNKTFSTLGAGYYPYNWTGCDTVGNCNSTDVYTYVILAENTTTLLYLNNTNNNYESVWNNSINITAYTSNLSLVLSINGTTFSNPFNGILGAGLYNVSVTNAGNINYTNSSQSWALNVTKLNTTTLLYLNGTRSDLSYIYSSTTSITINAESNATVILYFNDTLVSNPYTGIFSAGVYNITAITENTNNWTFSSETWTLNISKQTSNTTLFIDNIQSNTTKSYTDDNTNLTGYSTGVSLELYLNETLVTNPFIGSLGQGFYNITAITPENTNQTFSNMTYWLNISKQNLSIRLFLANTRGNQDVLNGGINITVYLFNQSGVLMSNSTTRPLSPNLTIYANFTGTWELNYTSSDNPLYVNYTSLTAGYWLVGGRWEGNNNYTGNAENWTLGVIDFNLTGSYSCAIPNFTYSNPSPAWLYNYTVLLTNTSSAQLPLIDFRMVELDTIRVTNATGGERLTIGNYSQVGWINFTSKVNSSYASKYVNITTRYYYLVLNNNTQKDIQPRWQNRTCGIFNLTLENAGTTTGGTLKARLASPTNFSRINISVKIGTDNNYTKSILINNNTYVTIMNMTKGNSNMTWHFMDFNNSNLSAPLTHSIDFKMFVVGF